MRQTTKLACLELLERKGVKTVIDAQGVTMPIYAAIEYELKWTNDNAKEYVVEGNRIARVMKVFVAGAVA